MKNVKCLDAFMDRYRQTTTFKAAGFNLIVRQAVLSSRSLK